MLLIETQTVNFITALPLAGIRLAEDPIDVENVRLRKLKPKELAQVAEIDGDKSWHRLGRRNLLPPFPRVAQERLLNY